MFLVIKIDSNYSQDSMKLHFLRSDSTNCSSTLKLVFGKCQQITFNYFTELIFKGLKTE